MLLVTILLVKIKSERLLVTDCYSDAIERESDDEGAENHLTLPQKTYTMSAILHT